MYLTIKELAKELQIKESKLRSMIFRGEIPYLKIGRLIRFRQIDVEKFIQENLKGIATKEEKR